MQEPPTKKRKVSLGGLLGKVKLEKKEEEKAPEMDELEQYLADTDVPDIDDPILDWWKVKARKWPALGKWSSNILLRRRPRRESSASSLRRARCTATCRSRRRTPRSSTR